MSAASPSLEDVFEQCCEMDASLAERLATFAEAVRTQRPAFGMPWNVCFTRKSKHGLGASGYPLCAKSGHSSSHKRPALFTQHQTSIARMPVPQVQPACKQFLLGPIA